MAVMLASEPAEARLTRFIVVERTAAAGHGDWVILRGDYEGEVDPADPRPCNGRVTKKGERG
jgi:hypothetical protein